MNIGLTTYKFPFITKEQLDAANSIIEILTEEKEILEEKLKQTQDKIDELNKRVDSANEFLLQSNDIIDDDELISYLRDEISFLTNEKNKCINEKKNLESQINKLTDDLKKANEEITKLKNENNNLNKEKNTLTNQLNSANTTISKLHNQMINLAYNSLSKFTNIIYDEIKKELRVNNLGKFVKSSFNFYDQFEIEFNKYLPNDGKTYYMRFSIYPSKDDVESIVCYPSGAFAPFGGIFLIFNTDEHDSVQTPYQITWGTENQMVYLTFSNFDLRNFLKYVDIELKQGNYDRVINSNDNSGLRDLILLLSYGNRTIFK